MRNSEPLDEQARDALSRRTLIRSAGLGALALSGLAACGNGESNEDGNSKNSQQRPENPDTSGTSASDNKSKPAGDDLDSLIAAASSEGTVTLYSSASSGPTNAVAQAFTKKYNIPVDIYRAGSSDVATRIESEESAGRPACDTTILDQPALEAIRKYLADYTPPTAAAISAEFKTKNSILIRMYPQVIAWNGDAVGSNAAPKDWPDLLNEKYSGKMATLDPHVTSVTLAWIVLMNDLYGKDFIKKFGALQPQAYSGTTQELQAIVSGETSVGVASGFGIPQFQADKAPIDGATPPNTLLFGGHAGVFTSAPHPNAARLLDNYLCSTEGQTICNTAGFTIPTHPDATTDPTAGTLKDLKDNHTISQPDYPSLLAKSEELLDQWDAAVRG